MAFGSSSYGQLGAPEGFNQPPPRAGYGGQYGGINPGGGYQNPANGYWNSRGGMGGVGGGYKPSSELDFTHWQADQMPPRINNFPGYGGRYGGINPGGGNLIHNQYDPGYSGQYGGINPGGGPLQEGGPGDLLHPDYQLPPNVHPSAQFNPRAFALRMRAQDIMDRAGTMHDERMIARQNGDMPMARMLYDQAGNLRERARDIRGQRRDILGLPDPEPLPPTPQQERAQRRSTMERMPRVIPGPRGRGRMRSVPRRQMMEGPGRGRLPVEMPRARQLNRPRKPAVGPGRVM